MKSLNSISLMIMGTGFMLVAFIMDNLWLKSILLVASIVLNLIAIVRNFREKKKNQL